MEQARTNSTEPQQRFGLPEASWDDLNEPGAYVERGSGDLYRVPKEALIPGGSPMMKTDVTMLLVMPRVRRLTLLAHLENCTRGVLAVSSCKEARGILETRPPMQVVLTDVTLPDGNWTSVLEDVVQRRLNAAVIVCTGLADTGLWCEVLQRGAYDLLVEPYERKEVQRIVIGAADRGRLRFLKAA